MGNMEKLVLGSFFLLVLFTVGLVDAMVVEGGLPGGARQSVSSGSSVLSSSSQGTLPTAGVGKSTGLDIAATILALRFTAEETSEQSLLKRTVPQNTEVQTRVLLRDDDRAGLISWMESAEVKDHFLSLKESLHRSFSPEISDLLDEIQRRPGLPPRNFLTFKDPGISEERIVFVRVRERLFEFHIVEGEQEAMYKLIDELSK